MLEGEDSLGPALATNLPPAGQIWIFESVHKDKKNTNRMVGVFCGASDLTRTGDLLITSEMHYRLCYTSIDIACLL